MTLNGTVKRGTIVLDDPHQSPEGARVEVVFNQAEDQTETLQEVLLKQAGTVPDLPADMAEQHDHYIHGTPKR
jgi:hypothetical protein